MILPSNHLFKFIPGVGFDFRFQYMSASSRSTYPVDLTNYTAQWTITDSNQTYIYGMGVTGSSGVFFGGSPNTPSNGIIDLILTPAVTAVLTSPADYQFILYPGGSQSNPIPLLTGNMVNANSTLLIV